MVQPTKYESMTIELNEKDLEGRILSIDDCPMVRALKRYGFKDVSAGGEYVRVNNKEHFTNYLFKVKDAQIRGFKSLTIEIPTL